METGELDRAVWEGSTRGDQDVGIVEQLEVFDVAGAAVVEHQVHLVDRWRIGFILDQADVASRLLVAQPADNVGQEHVGNALEGADIDASLAGFESVECGGHRLALLQQVSTVGKDDFAEWGDPHRLRSAGPVEHRVADVQVTDVRDPVYYGPNPEAAGNAIRGLWTAHDLLADLDPAQTEHAFQRLLDTLAARNTDGIWFDSRTWLVTAQRQ